MADYTDNLYEQYQRILDERDRAIELAERATDKAEQAFYDGMGVGFFLSGTMFLIGLICLFLIAVL